MRRLLKIWSFCTALLSLALSCTPQKVVVNREVETTKYGKMLLGRQTIDQFQNEPYSDWYTEEYANYQPDKESMKALKKEKINSYQILVFLGTWCDDSHREFPRLMKILDELKYSHKKLNIIGVNRKRESPAGEEGQHNIQRVPTIIVRKHGKEFGRIIEFPTSGYIEKDLLEIAKKRDTSINELLKTKK